MIDISISDFVDFVSSAGTPKVTKVRQVKNRPEYQPAFDFWKPMRESIVNFHKLGSTDKSMLNQILSSISDPKKLKNYPGVINAYQKFLGNKDWSWFKPPAGVWSNGGISIRVNPELGLILKGQPHAVKLYFKAEKLSKRRVDVILELMRETLDQYLAPGAVTAVLDVRQHKLFPSDTKTASLSPLLIGEAMNFRTIWDNL